MEVKPRPQPVTLPDDRKAILGGMVAHNLADAEAKLDAFIGSLGRGLAEMADGRAQAGLRASQCQPAFERFAGVIADSAALRGSLVRTHATFARDGRRAGIDWTAYGPTEPTPDPGEEDGPFPKG